MYAQAGFYRPIAGAIKQGSSAVAYPGQTLGSDPSFAAALARSSAMNQKKSPLWERAEVYFLGGE